MLCPVCKKEYKEKVGVSSHLFKTKDKKHIDFVEKQNEIIDKAFYSDISCETLAERSDCWVRTTYICERWRRLPNYKERKSASNSRSLKKQWAEGKKKISPNFTNKGYKYNLSHNNTIDEETYNKIISFFNTTLSFKQIAKKVNCNPKTVRPAFIREFGENEYNKRVKRVRSNNIGGKNKIEHTNPELYEKVIQEFHGNKAIKTVSSELKVGTSAIVRAWKKEFGEQQYKNRVAKMLRIQRERAAKTLKKAKFLGSKNERLCLFLLEKALSYKIKHHDYAIVPKLEIDISIPEIKIAICWDGIGHRKPVFGQEPFERVNKNDRIREKTLKEKGWRHISVIDDGSYNPEFVKEKVESIIELIEDDWKGKLEI